MNTDNIYYVYAWFYKETGEIFYIGKGKGNRCFERKAKRNAYFKNIVNSADVDVKILFDKLTNEESLNLERQLIHEYWNKGECKANFHEGGHGGYTGKYDDPERSRKISEAAKKRIGPLNPNYGNRWTQEQKDRLSAKNKGVCNITPEHIEKLRKINTGRIVSDETRKKLSIARAKQKISEHQIKCLVASHIDTKYQLFDKEELVFETVIKNDLYKYCKVTYNISRTIIDKIIDCNYKATFKRNEYINNLSIKTYTVTEKEKELYIKGVSTNPDECKGVE